MLTMRRAETQPIQAVKPSTRAGRTEIQNRTAVFAHQNAGATSSDIRHTDAKCHRVSVAGENLGSQGPTVTGSGVRTGNWRVTSWR